MNEGGRDRMWQNHAINELIKRTWNEYTGKTCIKQQLINDTGSPSVYGEIIIASTGADFAFDVAVIDSDHHIGSVYEGGVADGALCWIVIYGSAQVLLKNANAATHGFWVYTADVAGRVIMQANPPAPFTKVHMQECGHCLQTVGAGTNVLCEIDVHLN